MSSRSHDPFPMTSTEAKNLEASVESGQDKDWNRMGTTTQVSGPPTDIVDDAQAGTGLVKKKKSKKQARNMDVAHEAELNDDDDEEEEEDAFLDRPLHELRGGNYWKHKILGALHKLYLRLYGDKLPPSEMLKTLCLASTLFFMIGGYWLLRSLKDPVLTALCGVTVIPKAKMLSVFVVLLVVSIYNRLLDSDIPRHKLFYIFGTFYFGLFTVISCLLMDDEIGLANQQANPRRILGWISYCSIESFGSVMVSLFWSFANSNFSLETAKASYGVMVATAQVGSIIGPTVVNRYATAWGPAKCYLAGALCMLLLQLTMYMYISIYGVVEKEEEQQQDQPKKSSKPKAGILEGLQLFWEHNYVKGIFAISCLFMVEVTIVDYTMKVLARDYFAKLHPCLEGDSCWSLDGGGNNHGMSQDATAAFTTFMGLFGQATNTLSFLLSLLGTSAVIRYLGLRLSLLLFPSLCLAVIIMVRLHPSLYVVFAAMMMLKACSYALNNPTKEMLYQPTSSAVKYKAKSWIDIFGARGSKALGSLVTNAFSDSASSLVANGSLVGMAVASFLIWNARFMGRKFDEYTSTGHVVGEEPRDLQEQQESLEMAMQQNKLKDTSCALEDDDEVGPEEEGQSVEGSGGSGEDDDDDDDDDAKSNSSARIQMV